jgi:hypothetical protein
VPADAPKLRLRLIGWVPGLRDWRELAVEQFGPSTLIDPDHSTGKHKPNEGISETGRLVVLQMPAG